MKQKMIIGALAFASIFAFAQTTEDETSSETDRRFWGSSNIEYVDNCTPTTPAPDNTPQCHCTAHYTYYVFWIGFEGTQDWYGPCR